EGTGWALGGWSPGAAAPTGYDSLLAATQSQHLITHLVSTSGFDYVYWSDTFLIPPIFLSAGVHGDFQGMALLGGSQLLLYFSKDIFLVNGDPRTARAVFVGDQQLRGIAPCSFP